MERIVESERSLAEISLLMVGGRNLRLVHSFCFAGEVTHDPGPTPPAPPPTGGQSAGANPPIVDRL